jgi:hypothetical protein
MDHRLIENQFDACSYPPDFFVVKSDRNAEPTQKETFDQLRKRAGVRLIAYA